MIKPLAYCTYLAFGCLMAYVEAKWYSWAKMAILTFLLLLDTVTGIYKSYALRTVGEKEYYDNGKVKNTWFNTTVLKVWLIGKMLLLMLPLWLIAVAHLVGIDLDWVVPATVALLAWAEFISIIQNFIIARTKKPMQEFDAVSFVLQWVLAIIKDWIEKRLTTQPYKKDDY